MDIVKLAEYDPRVVQKRPAYAVDKGALSITNSPFPAIGLSTSQLTFNVQSPSLSVFLDRKVDLTAQVRVSFTATCKSAPAGLPGSPGTGSVPVLVIGRDIALCAHPIHSLVSTMTATINDSVVSTNTADVLYEIARLVDDAPSKIQRTTPSYLDKYVFYDSAVGAINNPLSSYFDATDYNNLPNGAYFDFKFTLPDGTDFPAGTGSYTSGASTVQFVNGVPVLTNTQTVYPLFMSFQATEKLFLSPFIWNEVVGDQVGLFGLNNFQLVLNLQAPTRLLRVAPNGSAGAYAPVTVSNVQYNSGATGGAIGSAKLNCLFLTPPLDINLPSRSVLSYMEFPRYVSTNPSTTVASGGSSQLISNTITLPVIPDMLLVYVKPGSYANSEGDYYLPITQISINFDNFSGLLASHTPEQLYHIAVKNGLRMDYNSWRGIGKVVRLNPAFTTIANLPASVPLVGGFLVLKMGEDIPLQTGLASGVVGSYSLQMTATCQNNSTSAVVAPQLFIIAVNSGVFETQAGQSRILRGLLTEQDVIQAPPAPESARDELERIVGGGFMSKLGTALSRATSLIKDVASNPAVQAGVRAVASRSSNPLIREVASAMPSGRGVAGGRRTGGRRGADMSALM